MLAILLVFILLVPNLKIVEFLMSERQDIHKFDDMVCAYFGNVSLYTGSTGNNLSTPQR